ncbi:hypothetical protein DITRI_Ditri11bG0006500 [Diplodiscus trichospermus]
MAKAWTYFSAARLLPITHLSSITNDRALLIYAIMEEFAIDVGRLICNNILHICDETTTSGLGYSSLIIALCLEAGVPKMHNEMKISTQLPIIGKIILGYRQQRVRGNGINFELNIALG